MAAICRKYTHVHSIHFISFEQCKIYIYIYHSKASMNSLYLFLQCMKWMNLGCNGMNKKNWSGNQNLVKKIICHFITTCSQKKKFDSSNSIFFSSLAHMHTQIHTDTPINQILMLLHQNCCKIFHYTCCSRPASFSIRPLLILLQSDINSFCCRSLTGN